VIEEAGGQMADSTGQPIDFSLGAKLSPTAKGTLMSNGGVFHHALIDAFAHADNNPQKMMRMIAGDPFECRPNRFEPMTHREIGRFNDRLR